MATGPSAAQAAWEGKIVPRAFEPVFIVLSCMISWIGAATTLELLNKRTGRHGWYNWYLLTASCVSMGGVGVWGMHYVALRSTQLLGGDPSMQLDYSSALTAVSFFIPVVVLMFSFYTLYIRDTSGVSSTQRACFYMLSGLIAGFGIALMHYTSNFGMVNYTCVYPDAGYIVGAVIIAVFASTAALTIFSVTWSTLTDSWWKRSAIASILAGGTSSMHWTAAAGTQYRYHYSDSSREGSASRNQIVIIVMVLSSACCIGLLTTAILAKMNRSQASDRAGKVALATVIFDNQGRIMTSTTCTLPSVKVTNHFYEGSLSNFFTNNHELYLWLYRASHCWGTICPLLPIFYSHLHATLYQYRDMVASNCFDTMKDENYATLFKEMFAVAAAQLARKISEPIEHLGTLHYDMLSTGQKPFASRYRSLTKVKKALDVEAQRSRFGIGQLLLLVKQVNDSEREHYRANSWVFMRAEDCANSLAKSLQVPTEVIHNTLNEIWANMQHSELPHCGLQLSFFGFRARVASLAGIKAGWDILVKQHAYNMLPTVPIRHTTPIVNKMRREQIDSLGGLNLRQAIDRLREMMVPDPGDSCDKVLFPRCLLYAMKELIMVVGDTMIDRAIVYPRVLGVPRRRDSNKGFVVVLHLSIPIHHKAPTGFKFIPFEIYENMQHCAGGSPDIGTFARRIRREFTPLVNQSRHLNSPTDKRRSRLLSMLPRMITDVSAARNRLSPGRIVDHYHPLTSSDLDFSPSATPGPAPRSPRSPHSWFSSRHRLSVATGWESSGTQLSVPPQAHSGILNTPMMRAEESRARHLGLTAPSSLSLNSLESFEMADLSRQTPAFVRFESVPESDDETEGVARQITVDGSEDGFAGELLRTAVAGVPKWVPRPY